MDPSEGPLSSLRTGLHKLVLPGSLHALDPPPPSPVDASTVVHHARHYDRFAKRKRVLRSQQLRRSSSYAAHSPHHIKSSHPDRYENGVPRRRKGILLSMLEHLHPYSRRDTVSSAAPVDALSPIHSPVSSSATSLKQRRLANPPQLQRSVHLPQESATWPYASDSHQSHIRSAQRALEKTEPEQDTQSHSPDTHPQLHLPSDHLSITSAREASTQQVRRSVTPPLTQLPANVQRTHLISLGELVDNGSERTENSSALRIPEEREEQLEEHIQILHSAASALTNDISINSAEKQQQPHAIRDNLLDESQQNDIVHDDSTLRLARVAQEDAASLDAVNLVDKTAEIVHTDNMGDEPVTVQSEYGENSNMLPDM